MPISEMYDRISAPLVFSHLIRCRSGCTRKSLAALPIDKARVFVQRRVSSPAGPGLAYFSYARQLQRQDEDDFWWYEPPAQRHRKHPTLPVDGVNNSILGLDTRSLHSTDECELMQGPLINDCLDYATASPSLCADAASVSSDSSANVLLPNEAALLPPGMSQNRLAIPEAAIEHDLGQAGDNDELDGYECGNVTIE